MITFRINFKNFLTFDPEENSGRIVGAQKHDLIFLPTDVHYGSIRVSGSQIHRLDREHSVGSEEREVQDWAAALPPDQRYVEGVWFVRASCHGCRKHHAVSRVRGHVVNNDGACTGVRYVHVHLAVLRVIDGHVLETRIYIRQRTQIDYFYNLQLKINISIKFLF